MFKKSKSEWIIFICDILDTDAFLTESTSVVYFGQQHYKKLKVKVK